MMDAYDCKMYKTVKVFIGFIPSVVTEEMLELELLKLGKLSSLFYIPDLEQESRGWAFVTFSEREDGLAAVEAINGVPYFEGSTEPCTASVVTPSNPLEYARMTCQPFTGPLTSPQFWQQFRTSDGVPYYYNMRTGQTQWECPVEIEHQTIRYRHGCGGHTTFGPPGSNLFVFHLPAEWGDRDLVHHFRGFGSIISARVQRDSSGRNRGFGFISYDNPHSALRAIKSMNGFKIAGKYLKVQLKKGEEQFFDPGFDDYTNSPSDSDIAGSKAGLPRGSSHSSSHQSNTDSLDRMLQSDCGITSSSQPSQQLSRTTSQAAHQDSFGDNSDTPLQGGGYQEDCTRGATDHEVI